MRLGRNPHRTCPQVRENAEEVRGNVAASYGGKTVGVKKNRRTLRFPIKWAAKISFGLASDAGLRIT